MRLMKTLLWLAAVVVIVFLWMDSPTKAVKRMFGIAPMTTDIARQPFSGLKLSLDLEARRQGRRVAVLLEDWFYCYPETNEVFMVPRTYETDFASIPPLARWAVNPFGNHAEAAVVHDWLYAVGESIESEREAARQKADNVFRYAMKEQNVNVAKRNLMYQAVRFGGGDAFGRADEWDEGFKDPETFARISPPPVSKPDHAAIYVMPQTETCADLPLRMADLIEEFGTFSN